MKYIFISCFFGKKVETVLFGSLLFRTHKTKRIIEEEEEEHFCFVLQLWQCNSLPRRCIFCGGRNLLPQRQDDKWKYILIKSMHSNIQSAAPLPVRCCHNKHNRMNMECQSLVHHHQHSTSQSSTTMTMTEWLRAADRHTGLYTTILKCERIN